MTKNTFELIEAYVAGHTLPPHAANALDRLCNNIKHNKTNWHDKNAEQVIKQVEEETLSLIQYYEKYHVTPSTLTVSNAFNNSLLQWKINHYKNLLKPSIFDTSHLFWYQKLIFALVVIATALVFAVVGMAAGIAIGAAIGGGAGSVLPALGTAFGGAAGAFTGGIVGAVKGLSFGIAVGAAIGFAVLGAIGVVAGWFIGRRVLPKKPLGHNNLDEVMRDFANTLCPDYVAPTPIPVSPARSSAASASATSIGPMTPRGASAPYSPLDTSASAPLLTVPRLEVPPDPHRRGSRTRQALFPAAAPTTPS